MIYLKTIGLTISLLINTACFSSPKVAQDKLRIVKGKRVVELSKEQLATTGLTQVSMDYNRAYPGQKITYAGVKVCPLLKTYHIESHDILEFISSDKFSVLIPATFLLNCGPKDSVAYLAIEPKSGWPILFNHTNSTAGPFALIWTNPELSYISDEYWAWSVVKIITHKKIDTNNVIGAPKMSNSPHKAAIVNGYKTYISHCASCHTINHIGKASIGPDLNQPKNPLDYYPDRDVLKKFIRNPESVRKLKNGRMSGSSYVGLHDNDLDDLIDYFEFIRHKPAP